ncbi:MAG: hypothetical protein C5B58_15385 [Acidobacteria bacterium]|nr:MAG: hypothetical protein C5B58_15385 [Acidobacteriota bacterium]
MKIIFGLDLEGYQDSGRRDRFNELISGPNGLLGLLELRLGLISKLPSTAVRVAQYHNLLRDSTSKKPQFYSESFKKDAFSTAETLLRWRDELILAGWNGSAHPNHSSRLRDFAELESMGGTALSPGFGDRVRLILTELDRRDAKLGTIEVVENREHIPFLLRKLLVKLGAAFGCAAGGISKPAGRPGTDLWKLQEALTGPGETAQIDLAHDGTVIFVSAYSEVTLAHHAAQILRKNRRQNVSSAIIAENECLPLEVALRALDEPVLALSACSSARPVLQTLALALALRWEPLDPRDLLAFLAHPVSPVNKRFRRKLAAKVAECPGIGGSEWNSGIEEHHEFLRKKFSSDQTALSKALKQAEGDLAQWITVERFNPLTGAPGDELASTCRAVASWAMATAAGPDLPSAMAEQYQRLASDAGELGAILKPLLRVPRAQLDRLLDQIVGNGVQSNYAVPEAGHAQRLKAPGAFLEPVETVLWWGFRERSCSPIAPWTKSEIEQLGQSGAELLSPAARYARESFAVRRAVFAAKKQLIFMTPRRVGNEPVVHHSLRDRMQALVVDKLPVFDLDQYLPDPVSVQKPILLTPELKEFSRRQLPGIRRWWKLPNGQYLGPKDFESFTSAEKFIFSPYQWVLEYKAQLKQGILFGNPLVNQSRQRGNLLHRFSERVFSANSIIDWRAASRQEVRHSLEAEWKRLLPTEGANLLLAGNRAQAESLFDEGVRAIWSLIEHLRKASATKTSVNVSPLPAPFVGGELRGYIDLLVENDSGLEAIVDLKYNGHDEKKDELANNLQLQLAVYGYLVANGARWPESAFFILKKCALLTQNRNYFPGADIVRLKESGAGLEVCWKEFEELWKWRRNLLDQGWIELTVGGANPNDSAGPKSNWMPPIVRWMATDDEDRFNDFDALTGWEEDK